MCARGCRENEDVRLGIPIYLVDAALRRIRFILYVRGRDVACGPEGPRGAARVRGSEISIRNISILSKAVCEDKNSLQFV